MHKSLAVHVIGGGLAGSEAAWQLVSLGVPVVLHEMRPVRSTAAHRTDGLAELVCSNSFRADDWRGNAVGLLHEDVRFETVDVTFGPGDLFVFYTDGITEAEDPSGADFGRERLAATVRSVAGQPAEAVVSAVHAAVGAFRGSGPDGDDATVIVVRVPPSSA